MDERLHPSAFELEAFSTGSPEIDVKSVRAHTDACGVCQTYLRELQEAQSDLMTRLTPEQFARALRAQADAPRGTTTRVEAQTPFWTRLLEAAQMKTVWAMTAAAAVAVFGILMYRANTLPETLPSATAPSANSMRVMGDSQVTVYLNHEGQVRPAEAAAEVVAGDALRIKVRLTQPQWVAAWFIDEQGNISWYAPEDGQHTALRFEAGEHTLGTSAVFDEAQGAERLFVAFRSEPFTPESLAQELRSRWKSSGRPLSDAQWVGDAPHVWTSVFKRQSPVPK